ncbi:MAG: AsmA family protein [Verrucomicrobia bacterium]|nr:MAG: AsmA family protein [Verrucomicrobiota bacterium]
MAARVGQRDKVMARRDPDFEYDDPLNEPGRWKRWLIRLAVLLVLLVGLYFVGTSGYVLRQVVLPWMTRDWQGSLHAGSIEWSPFSRLHATDVELRDADGEPVFTAREIEARYSLLSLWRNRWLIPKVRLVSPELHVVRDASGQTTWDRIWGESRRRPWISRPIEELQVGLIQIENGAWSYQRELAGGERTRMALRNFDLTLVNLGDGRESTWKLAARFGMEKLGGGPDAPDSAGRFVLSARSEGALALSSKRVPTSLKGSLELTTEQATGAYATMEGLTGRWLVDLAEKEIRQCLLEFRRGGDSLGRLTLQGPIDTANRNLRVRLKLDRLRHEILNLAGSPFGLGFGESELDADVLVDVSGGGQTINVSSTLAGRRLSLRTPAGATPEVGLESRIDGRAQLDEKTADIRSFRLSLKEGDRDLLQIRAPRAINLLWNPLVRPSVNESSLEIRLDGLDLARWRPLLGPRSPSGRLYLEAALTNRDDGRRIRGWITNRIEELAFTAGPYTLTNAALRLTTQVAFRDFLSFSVDQTEIELAADGAPLLTGEGSGSYELGNDQLRLLWDFRGELPPLLTRFPHPLIEASGGTWKLDGNAQLQAGANMVAATLVLDQFTGRIDRYHFIDDWLQFDASIDWTPELISVRQIALSLGRGTGRGGSVYLSGRASPRGDGAFELSLVNLGPASLRPLLEAHLGPWRLGAGHLDGQGRLQLGVSGARELELHLQTRGLALSNAWNRRTHFPLDLTADLGASYKAGSLLIYSNIISLPATPRAPNTLILTGAVQTVAGQPGHLRLFSSALDLSAVASYYRTNTAPTAAGVPTTTAPSLTITNPPIWTRLTNYSLVTDLDVRRLLFDRIDTANWRGRTLWTNGLLVCQDLSVDFRPKGNLRLRGQWPLLATNAPVRVEAAARALPIDPIASTLLGYGRGRFVGDLSANLTYAATSPLDATGSCELVMTNLDFRTLPDWTRAILNAPASILGADPILRSPAQSVHARLQLQGPELQLDPLEFVGDWFSLRLSGPIHRGATWREASFDLPVALTIRRDQLRIPGAANLPAAALPDHLQLPPFVSVRGTLADWETVVDRAKLGPLVTETSSASAGSSVQSAPGIPDAPAAPDLRSGDADTPTPSTPFPSESDDTPGIP